MSGERAKMLEKGKQCNIYPTFYIRNEIVNAFRLQPKCECKKMSEQKYTLTRIILALEAIKSLPHKK